jgi:TonB family protein
VRRQQCLLPGLAIVLIAVPAFAAQQSSPTASTSATEAAQPVIDADGVYHVGNGVTVPKLVYSVDTEFSDAARRRKIEAEVVLGLTVMPDGRVANVHVTRSAAEDFAKPKDRKAAATLDPKAVEAVEQYRFEPGAREGKAVPVAITIVVNFHNF